MLRMQFAGMMLSTPASIAFIYYSKLHGTCEDECSLVELSTAAAAAAVAAACGHLKACIVTQNNSALSKNTADSHRSHAAVVRIDRQWRFYDFQFGEGNEGAWFLIGGHLIGTTTGLVLRTILCKSLVLMPRVKFRIDRQWRF